MQNNIIQTAKSLFEKGKVQESFKILVEEFEKHPSKWWVLLYVFKLAERYIPETSDSSLVIYTPDYKGNPYQELMYSHFDCEVIALPKSLSEVACMIAAHKNTSFHFHWLKEIFKSCSSKSEFVYQDNYYRSLVKALKLVGVKIFWTIHNKMEHDLSDEAVIFTKAMMSYIAKHSDKVHVHFDSAILEMSEFLELSEDSIDYVVVEHPVYSISEAQYSAPSEIPVGFDRGFMLSLGMIRPYKQIGMLVSAARKLLDSGVKFKLVIAGSCQDPVAREEALKLQSDYPSEVFVLLRKLSDAEVNWFYSRAKCSILTYSKILTSGSYYMSAAHGVASLAPDIGMFKDAITDGLNGFKFNGTQDGLCEGLRRVCKLSNEVLINIGNECAKSCKNDVQMFSKKIKEIVVIS